MKFPFFGKLKSLACNTLRDLIKEILLKDREKRKKAQHLAGIKPMTLKVFDPIEWPYCCSAIVTHKVHHVNCLSFSVGAEN